MKSLLFIGLILLSGCSKETDEPPRLTLAPSIPIPEVPAPRPEPQLVIDSIAFLGQSNIVEGNGFSNGFKEEAKAFGKGVSCIECAVGGSSISQWQKGQPLYDVCMTRMLIERPSAIVFWQGEADVSLPTYSNWQNQFSTMLSDIRQDLGYEIPVIVVRISNVNAVSYPRETATIRDFQTYFNVPNIQMFNIDGFDSMIWVGHEPHYQYEGYYQIGRHVARQHYD